MSNVMLDLETMGTGNGAPVISIGAVRFDATGILSEFHVGITLQSNVALGRQIDPDTLMWWLDPERDTARAEWLGLPKKPLTEALQDFHEWATVGDPVEAMWGNGATFDNVILRDACATAGVPYPVRFWQDKCYRTMKGLRPDIKLVRVGTYHNAADDAKSQALHLIEIAKVLGVEL